MMIFNIIILIWCIFGVLEYSKLEEKDEKNAFLYGPFAWIWFLIAEIINWDSFYKRK